MFKFFKVDNGIPILSYYDNQNDNELNDLANYLKSIVEFDDLRDANKSFFKFNHFKHYEETQDLI